MFSTANCLGQKTDLTLRHLPFLVGHLSKFAYKWRDIGTALHFQPQDLRNIEACPVLIATGPASFMQRLVEEWLEGKHRHTAPPTLANLLKALNSHTVGLGTLAILIGDSLPQNDQKTTGDIAADKVFEIASRPDLETRRDKHEISCNENMHVHLKVKTSCKTRRSDWTVSRKKRLLWMDLDSNKTTLCIPRADIDMDGDCYSCEVILDSKVSSYGSWQYTPTAVLRVGCPQLDQFRDSLASIYLAQPEVPEDSWPPVSSSTYINLVLIKREKVKRDGEYAHLTVQGDMDDILHCKEKIEYENIFDELKSGSLLLIEGRPGSGKTTFVHKITRDWAASEVQGPMRLVLLVSLRVFTNWGKPITLDDILQLLDFQDKGQLLKERKGKGVCFIFDGLDEFSPQDGENSIVYKIIKKTHLPESIVIVASRPSALVKLRQRANKMIEVIGFTKKQIIEYFENYPFSSSSKIEQQKSYLLDHPNVLQMCYLPIHAAMVAFLFEVIGEIPRTETEVYSHFTRFTLIRSLSKHKGQEELEDIDTGQLGEKEAELLNTICKIAFEKTLLNKQVLDQDEMKLRLFSKGYKDTSLGLVTVDRTAGLYGFKNIYTFLHLTYQEYLAAHHISTLSDEDQLKLIQQYGDTDHMQVVWKFYCGIVNFEGHEYKIKALIGRRNKIILSDIQHAYESQQEIVCNSLMKEMDAQIVLEDKCLTTMDFTAIGYLLANSSKPASLSIIKCELNTEAVEALLAETGETFPLQALSCASDDLDLPSIERLLKHQHGLQVLKLKNFGVDYSSSIRVRHINCMLMPPSRLASHAALDCYISPKYTQFFTHNLSDIVSSLTMLKEFSLTNVLDESRTVSKVLQFCKELTSLTLNGSIEKEDIQPLLTGVSKCKKLEKVSCSTPFYRHEEIFYIDVTRANADLDELSAPDELTSMLCVQGVIRGGYHMTLKLRVHDDSISVHQLEYSTEFWPPKLKTLALYQNFHRKQDMITKLAKSIADFSALEKLVLNGMKISHEAVILAKILSKYTVLQELDLSNNVIGTPGEITAILTGLNNCSKLRKLVLNESHIKIDGACVLASCLQHWPELQELHVSGCDIEERGAKAIADNVRHCPELNHVNFQSQ